MKSLVILKPSGGRRREEDQVRLGTPDSWDVREALEGRPDLQETQRRARQNVDRRGLGFACRNWRTERGPSRPARLETLFQGSLLVADPPSTIVVTESEAGSCQGGCQTRIGTLVLGSGLHKIVRSPSFCKITVKAWRAERQALQIWPLLNGADYVPEPSSRAPSVGCQSALHVCTAPEQRPHYER
jgi:hypothetical protein